MLVLQRSVNESFDLDRDGEFLARVTVYRAKDGKMRLGIDAPPSVRVRRSELLPREAPAPEAA